MGEVWLAKFGAPVVAFVGTAGVVPGIAPCAGWPVARHSEQNVPAVMLLIEALSMMRRSGFPASAAAMVSTFTGMG